jgi:hypothetical protein
MEQPRGQRPSKDEEKAAHEHAAAEEFCAGHDNKRPVVKYLSSSTFGILTGCP